MTYVSTLAVRRCCHSISFIITPCEHLSFQPGEEAVPAASTDSPPTPRSADGGPLKRDIRLTPGVMSFFITAAQREGCHF